MNRVKYISQVLPVLPIYDGGNAEHRDLVLAGISDGLVEFLPGQTPTLTAEGAAVARLAKFYAVGKKVVKRVGFIGRPPHLYFMGIAANLGPSSCTTHTAPSSVWDKLSTDLDNNVF
jgi:hypothetical protein